MSVELIVGLVIGVLNIGTIVYVVNRMSSLAGSVTEAAKTALTATTATVDAKMRAIQIQMTNEQLTKTCDQLTAEKATEHEGRLNAEERLHAILEKYARVASPDELAAGINDELDRLRALRGVPAAPATEGGPGAGTVHGPAAGAADVPVADPGSPLR